MLQQRLIDGMVRCRAIDYLKAHTEEDERAAMVDQSIGLAVIQWTIQWNKVCKLKLERQLHRVQRFK